MDSIISSALSEICSEGIKGIPLTKLWQNLKKPLTLSGLNLCNGVKKEIWNRILNNPSLEFKNKKGVLLNSRNPSVKSFEKAEKLELKIIATENLRDCFVGLYDLNKVSDNGISQVQRDALDRLARARSDGILQSELAKEFGKKGNSFFYIVNHLECQGLIVRQPTIVKTKKENGTSIVTTNLIRLHRYAKPLDSQQRFEITKAGTLECSRCGEGNTSTTDYVEENHVKDDVVVKDKFQDMKSVCAELEKADGKILAVSVIRKLLDLVGAKGRRKWRTIRERLRDAGLVDECRRKVNNRMEVKCLRLLKEFFEKHFQPKPVLCGFDDFETDQTERCGSRGKITEQLLELPIEHQIHDMIAAEGSKGIPIIEVCKRLGINNKINHTLLNNMFSRFGCHVQRESHNRSFLNRVWTSGCFSGGTSTSPPVKSADVVGENELSNQRTIANAANAQREQRILQRLEEEKFILKVELCRWLESLDKEKCTTIAMQTSFRTINELQKKGQCKVFRLSVTGSSNRCDPRTVDVVLHKSIQTLPPEILAQILKTAKPVHKQIDIKRIFSPVSSVVQAVRAEEETHAQSAEELGANGEEDRDDLTNQSALSDLEPSRKPKFSWTETSDRQLVIQYVRYRSALGPKYYRTVWSALPDLPAPPKTCKRRMSFLRSNQTVRRAIMRLCNLLGERYAKHLAKSKEKELLNHDNSGHIVQNSSLAEKVGRKSSNCLERDMESDFDNKRWDDFEDQNLRGELDELLRCVQIAKLEGYKRGGPSPEKELPDSNLEAQAYDFEELDSSTSTTTSAEQMQNHVGKRKLRSGCHHLPRKFFKLVNGDISDNTRAYDSLAVANAMELLKLVLLSTSATPEVQTLLTETLGRYSEDDLFVAFNYLREKKIMVRGNGGQPFELSRQFLNNMSSSPFPINTGERVSKFASWLHERDKDLMEDEIHLSADLQCGDIFHLLALVSSGELFMSPCLPDEGVGEADENRSSRRRTYEDEQCNADQVKKPVSLLMYDGGECGYRREKGFPGIKVSLIRTTISATSALEFFKNKEIDTSSSSLDENYESVYDALEISGNTLRSRTIDESLWKTICSYGESLASLCSNQEQVVGPLYPELFQKVHAIILKSGGQGLSMEEVSQVPAISGERMAELVVDVLQVFGLASKVNAYDHIRVVDASFRCKYFLSLPPGHYQEPKSSPRMVNDDNYVKLPQECVKNAETSMGLDGVHKETILNLPEEVSQLLDAQPRKENASFEDNMQVEDVMSSVKGMKENEDSKCTTPGDSHSFTPILPWINGDGTTNLVVYKVLTRRVLGIVMQNPGILEDDVIRQMNTLNPQSCRKLLELLELDNHLIVRKMYQTTSSGLPPTLLHSLSSSSILKKPEGIWREHYFANPMCTSLL